MSTRAAFPVAQLRTLSNGVRCLALRLPRTASAQLLVLVRAGPRFEDGRTHGISHLCEHMLFRGCGRHRDSQAVARAADAFMGQLDGATYRDHVTYGTACEPTRLAQACTLLAHMMTSPRMQGLAVEKRVILEEIGECFDEQNREIEIENLAHAQLYGSHPAGLSIDGTLSSVAGHRLATIRQHHASHYVGGNMLVAVAAPLPTSSVLRTLARAFQRIPAGSPRPLPQGTPSGPAGPTLRVVPHPGPQTELRLSFHACPAAHPHATALQVLRRVLDDGFSSRLQAELIDRRGLAYELWGELDLAEDSGSLELGASVSHGKEARTVRALLEQVRRLRREVPSRTELRRASERLAWGLRLMHEQPAAVVEWHARALALGLERDPVKVLKLASAVTGTQVRQVARELLCARRLAVTAVGDVPRPERAAMRRALQTFP